jgi:4-hydroxy-3-polyprenylbenzoate decarboxylase
MHQRRLPSFPDLSSFLAHLDAAGDVCDIDAPVSMELEITELHCRVIAAGGPVLRLKQPLTTGGAASAMPVLTNLFGTRERVAAGLGTDPEGLQSLGALLAWMKSPKPPHTLRQARALLPAARGAMLARPNSSRLRVNGARPIPISRSCRSRPAGRAMPARSSPGLSSSRVRRARTIRRHTISASTACR